MNFVNKLSSRQNLITVKKDNYPYTKTVKKCIAVAKYKLNFADEYRSIELVRNVFYLSVKEITSSLLRCSE